MLLIKAELDNITDLQPQGGCDDDNFRYYFKVSIIFSIDSIVNTHTHWISSAR